MRKIAYKEKPHRKLSLSIGMIRIRVITRIVINIAMNDQTICDP